MNSPVRILNLFMILDRGGAETLVMNIYRHIDRTKVQFDFLVHGDKIGAYEEEILELGGKIFRLPHLSLLKLPEYLSALKAFFQAHTEYQIIHGHTSELGLFILREAKKNNIPIRICHAHNAPHGFHLNSPVRWLFKKQILQYTTHMMACGEKAGQWQFGKRQYLVIRNGINTNEYHTDSDMRKKIRDQYSISEEHFVIGHIGRFTYQKNHEFILELFAKVHEKRPESILMLVGDGVLRPDMERMAEKLGITKNIRFTGVLTNIPAVLQAFDVFVFPSRFEGLGIAALEAQAAGLKCLCSNNVPIEANVTEQCTFLPLRNLDTWVNFLSQMDNIKSSPEEALQKIKEAGYDISSSANFLESFYLNHSYR